MEQIITSSETTDRTIRRQSTDEEYVKVESGKCVQVVLSMKLKHLMGKDN